MLGFSSTSLIFDFGLLVQPLERNPVDSFLAVFA